MEMYFSKPKLRNNTLFIVLLDKKMFVLGEMNVRNMFRKLSKVS